ncbi:MAG TPA: MoaD/ThiS family protein [Candidatus Acidoferrum sp.]|nr:MoaD/ThiS family protein [Candidatus Acidoferrum sp.]
MSKILMRYKGIIASILETSTEIYELSDPTLNSLLNSVNIKHGYDLKKLVEDNPSYIVLINGKNIDLSKHTNTQLADGTQLEVIATIAGGCC